MQKLRIRVVKAYANDKILVPIKLKSIFNTPLCERLQYHNVELHKLLDTICAAKQTYTFTTVTYQVKVAYSFG